MAGRGSFIESFPLFGYDLADYDQLFNEKMDMLLAIKEQVNQSIIDLFTLVQFRRIFQYGLLREETLIQQ